MRKAPLVLCGLIGFAVGAGIYTFHYGEGLSYFSTDPRACVNCHIMNDQYVSRASLPPSASNRQLSQLPAASPPASMATAAAAPATPTVARETFDSLSRGGING